MPEQLNVEWLSDEKLSEKHKAQIEGLVISFFPEHFVGGRYRFGEKLEDPHRLLVWEADVLVAHILAVTRHVGLNGERLKLLFVGELCVRKESQGKGLGRKLIESLEPHLRDFDLALLCCRRELLGFYQKCGWELLDIKVFFGPDEARSRCEEGIVVARVRTQKARQALATQGSSLYLGEHI